MAWRFGEIILTNLRLFGRSSAGGLGGALYRLVLQLMAENIRRRERRLRVKNGGMPQKACRIDGNIICAGRVMAGFLLAHKARDASIHEQLIEQAPWQRRCSQIMRNLKKRREIGGSYSSALASLVAALEILN